MTDSEQHNRMVWDGRQRGHYEVWWTTFNHRPTQTGFWIRYTLESPCDPHQHPYCQLWFAFFDARTPEANVAYSQRYPIEALGSRGTPFRVKVADAVLEHGALRGALAGRADPPLPPVSWDLRFRPCNFTHLHLPSFAYRGSFADTVVLSPNLQAHIEGTVKVGERCFELAGEPGCQSHLWGRKHAHTHVWAHCSAFREDATAALEALSVRLRRGGLVTPTLTMLSLYLGNEVFHFREPWAFPLTKGRWETGLYRFRAFGRKTKIEGEMRCRPEDLVRAHYVDPDGEPTYCHNTEVGDVTVTVYQRRALTSPFRRLQRLTARAAGHFEYVRRTPDPAIEAIHHELPIEGG